MLQLQIQIFFSYLPSTASTRSWAEPVTLAENAGMIPSSNLPWWPPVARSCGIPTHPGHRSFAKTDLQRLWLWIYGGFMVDLPIEHDDFMGFWYGILVWVTLWLWLTGLAMVKPWPIDEIDGPNPVLSMVVIFHGEVLVITRWYIKKETSKIFTRKLWILDILDLCCLYKTMVNTHG